MENGQDDLELSRPQTSTLFSPQFFAAGPIGWSSQANDTSHDADSNENGSPQRVLTRRQRAALSVGRTMGNDTAPVSKRNRQISYQGLIGIYQI